ncbi:MAG: hypothetical protein JSW55_11710, partial [Chloroflexota bacterium]
MIRQWLDRKLRIVLRPERVVTWLTLFWLLLLYWIYIRTFERIDYFSMPPDRWLSVEDRYPLLDLIEPVVLIALEFISPRVLRHFIPVLIGALLAHLAVQRFLVSFYDLPDLTCARKLLSRLRAWRLPKKPLVRLDADNFKRKRREDPLLRVGGPLKVNVERGSVIVTEINGRRARVLGPGICHLARFERPFTIIDLRPQDRQKDEATMMTRDGIDITASVGVTFHIESNDQSPSHDVPFPFDE